MRGGGGGLALPDPLAQWLGVAGLNARGRYQGASQVLEIEEIIVDRGRRGARCACRPRDTRFPLEKVRASGRYFRKERRLEVRSLRMETGGPVAVVKCQGRGSGR